MCLFILTCLHAHINKQHNYTHTQMPGQRVGRQSNQKVFSSREELLEARRYRRTVSCVVCVCAFSLLLSHIPTIKKSHTPCQTL